jgi:hypothetical protein
MPLPGLSRRGLGRIFAASGDWQVLLILLTLLVVVVRCLVTNASLYALGVLVSCLVIPPPLRPTRLPKVLASITRGLGSNVPPAHRGG